MPTHKDLGLDYPEEDPKEQLLRRIQTMPLEELVLLVQALEIEYGPRDRKEV